MERGTWSHEWTKHVAQETNRKLDKIFVGINKAYQDVCDKDSYVTAEKVRNSYLGMGMNHKTLLADSVSTTKTMPSLLAR